MAEKKNKPGRPKNVPVEDIEVNEKDRERLDMSKDKQPAKVTIE